MRSPCDGQLNVSIAESKVDGGIGITHSEDGVGAGHERHRLLSFGVLDAASRETNDGAASDYRQGRIVYAVSSWYEPHRVDGKRVTHVGRTIRAVAIVRRSSWIVTC